MAPKPHRLVLDRVGGYAEEAAAFLRRRRLARRPFARVYRAGGQSACFDADSERGRALFRAAAELMDAARPEQPPMRSSR